MKQCIICGREWQQDAYCKDCGFPTKLPLFVTKQHYLEWTAQCVIPHRRQWRFTTLLEQMQNELNSAKREIQRLNQRVAVLEKKEEQPLPQKPALASNLARTRTERKRSIEPESISDSWEEIFASIAQGTYQKKYRIGDTKLLPLGSEGTIAMQIAAFDRDILAEGSGRASITWIAKDLLSSSRMMNTQASSAGGWKTSGLRKYLQSSIYRKIPEYVKKEIKPVKKYTRICDGNTLTEQETEDRIWIPGYTEMYPASRQIEPRSITYTDTLFTTSESRIKKKVGENLPSKWWLRRTDTSYSFYFIVQNGNYYGTRADSSLGIAIGFCT